MLRASRAASRRFIKMVPSESVEPYELHKANPPASSAIVTKDELLKYYSEMQLIRRMEIECDNLYKNRLIRGFCHLYDGQEAVAVGLKAGLKPGDYTITAYRDHAQQYIVGDTIESIMAELLGKSTGCSKGKGGSMHLYHTKRNFFGGNGIVGAQVPLGVGLALAAQYNGNDAVSVTMYGDGASNQGQIAEAANIAALWKLPAIFICENNQYGMGTSIERSSANTKFYTRGDVIPGILVDGMDVIAVREAVKWAADHCRTGNGPMFMEMKTYRYHGHSMSDPGVSYRTRDEVSTMRVEKDCIAKVKALLLKQDWATESHLKEVDKKNRAIVDDAVKKAKSASELPPEELFTDIYDFGPPKFVRYPDFMNSKHF